MCGFVQAPSQRIGTGIGQQFGTRDRQDGTPAATIYDNVVVASQGRALQMVALGPVSIHGNQFTSLGSDLRNRPDDTALGLNVPADSPLLAFADALGGAVVWVFNLGVSNEIFGQLLGFAGLGIADELAQPEEDDPLPGNPLAGGNILFNDNQGVLDALNPGNTLAFSSVALLCLDDIGMRGNQCDSDLLSDDFLVSQLLAWGFSVRSTSNRFKEGALQALLSATTIGQLNTTTDNQGTHCFLRVAPVLPSFDENTVLAERFQGNACRFAETLQGNLRAELFPES